MKRCQKAKIRQTRCCAARVPSRSRRGRTRYALARALRGRRSHVHTKETERAQPAELQQAPIVRSAESGRAYHTRLVHDLSSSFCFASFRLLANVTRCLFRTRSLFARDAVVIGRGRSAHGSCERETAALELCPPGHECDYYGARDDRHGGS